MEHSIWSQHTFTVTIRSYLSIGQSLKSKQIGADKLAGWCISAYLHRNNTLLAIKGFEILLRLWFNIKNSYAVVEDPGQARDARVNRLLTDKRLAMLM